MSKKALIFLMMLFICIPPVKIKAADAVPEEGIEDIKENPNQFEKGVYKAAGEEKGPQVQKGQGFDFKAPEILIKGQIDTKIILKREMSALENLQDVKNILYEKERVEMPEYYLKEDTLNPTNMEISQEKDFVGRMKISAGSFNNFLFDGVAGKSFDSVNSGILRLFHNNHDNEKVNDRDTYSNNNLLDARFNTAHGPVDAVYSVGGIYDEFSNPFPENLMGSRASNTAVSAGASYQGEIGDTAFSTFVKYLNFSQTSATNGSIYRENRVRNKISLDREFEIEKGRMAMALFDIDWHAGRAYAGGKTYDSVFDADCSIKGVLRFEPAILQFGVRIQDDNFSYNEFRLSPYFNLNYDVAPYAALYFVFDPSMKAPDYTEELKTHFTAFDPDTKVPYENLGFRAGGTLNLFELFFNAYYGQRSVNNYAYYDESGQKGIFILKNTDLDYSYAGVNAETLKAAGFRAEAQYLYRGIINSGAVVTDFSRHFASFRLFYERGGWETGVTAHGESDSYGTSTAKVPAFANIDLSLTKKLSDNVSVFGYVNNVLNNNSYVLYYYKDLGLNLGVGLTLNY
jgi:outer membrane receptor protein involved in Fe transport